METLAHFGHALQAASITPGTAGPSTNFCRDYESALARETAQLWELTMGDAHFCRALLLASPSAWQRAQAAASKRGGPRNRALRLVEYMLYRYLSRASSRITPNGLWAGVTDVRIGDGSRIERCAGTAHFTPELGVFQLLLRQLGTRETYRRRLPWRLNPTLAMPSGGTWTFLHRTGNGTLERHGLGFDPALGEVLDRIASCRPAPLLELATQLAPGAEAGAWLPLLERLADGGILVGGLDLPEKFVTPWQALEAAADRLLPDHARAWRRAAAALEEGAQALADATWSATPADYALLLARPTAIVSELAAALTLPAPATPLAWRCDLRLPWRLVIDRARHADLLHALRAYDRHWLRGASAAMAERGARRSAFTDGLGDGLGLADAAALAVALAPRGGNLWPPAAHSPQDAVAARLACWEAVLREPAPTTTLGVEGLSGSGDLAPWGCWLVGVDAGGGIHSHGVSDLPSVASARLGGVLDLRRHDAWLRAALAVASRERAPLVEYLAPFEPNPNALAGPMLIDASIAPWRASAADTDLRGARLVRAARQPWPLLESVDGRRHCVVALAGANLQAQDPLAEALLWTGYRDAGGPGRHAIDVPLQDELDAPRYTPRVTLPGGSVLSPRRTVLGAELQGLRRRQGAARFWYWQQLAQRYGWPAELEVGNHRGGMLRVPRDSPLAVDALCKGLVAETPYLMVREAAGGIALAGNAHHVVEIAMPFVRPRDETERRPHAR